MMSDRDQIDPWTAIKFAISIDDHYDRLAFLEDALMHDMTSIAADWPDFVDFAGQPNDR